MTTRAYACQIDDTAELSTNIFAPGQVVAGEYTVRRHVGSGGFAQVFEVVDREGKAWALKAMRTISKSRKEVRRAIAEADMYKLINHPHVCRFHASGIEGNTIYTVTELLRGVPLRAEMAKGPIDVERALRLGRQICHGLEAVHQRNIVHRDVKPSNVFLCDNADVIKLMDFNSAKHNSRITLLATRGTIGTPLYMCRSQLEFTGTGQADPRWDIYAAGLVIIEMIAGFHPFFPGGGTMEATQAVVIEKQFNQPIPSLCELMPGFPKDVSDPVAKAVERDPNKQYSDVGDFARALNNARRWWKQNSDPSYVPLVQSGRASGSAPVAAATEKIDPDALAALAARDSASSPVPAAATPPPAQSPKLKPKAGTGPRQSRFTGDGVALVLGLLFGAIAWWCYQQVAMPTTSGAAGSALECPERGGGACTATGTTTGRTA